jgi:hypothetical protein
VQRWVVGGAEGEKEKKRKEKDDDMRVPHQLVGVEYKI